MAKLVFGMMQSLDGYVDGVAGELGATGMRIDLSGMPAIMSSRRHGGRSRNGSCRVR
jgi:hypothetical protein